MSEIHIDTTPFRYKFHYFETLSAINKYIEIQVCPYVRTHLFKVLNEGIITQNGLISILRLSRNLLARPRNELNKYKDIKNIRKLKATNLPGSLIDFSTKSGLVLPLELHKPNRILYIKTSKDSDSYTGLTNITGNYGNRYGRYKEVYVYDNKFPVVIYTSKRGFEYFARKVLQVDALNSYFEYKDVYQESARKGCWVLPYEEFKDVEADYVYNASFIDTAKTGPIFRLIGSHGLQGYGQTSKSTKEKTKTLINDDPMKLVASHVGFTPKHLLGYYQYITKGDSPIAIGLAGEFSLNLKLIDFEDKVHAFSVVNFAEETFILEEMVGDVDGHGINF